jgi:drug/metabolite transporter (DMT)-like permease
VIRGLHVRSRRGAYAALGLLTLIWGFNWIVMKFALANAHPAVFNVQRTWVAIAVLFACLILQKRPFWPTSWKAVAITAIFQTTLNFTATTMALAGGGAGRTSVLVFTMPFWTLLIAWPVLRERVHGSQWLAIASALFGLVLVVAPWNWHDDLTPKLWATLSGFGWAAGTVATKYYQRQRNFDLLNFIAWQMLIGTLPLTLIPLAHTFPETQWSITQVALLIYIGAISTALGFVLWIEVLRWLPAGTASLNMFAVPVIALVSSMAIFGERVSVSEWWGIACIGAGLVMISVAALRASRRGSDIAPVAVPAEGG